MSLVMGIILKYGSFNYVYCITVSLAAGKLLRWLIKVINHLVLVEGFNMVSVFKPSGFG